MRKMIDPIFIKKSIIFMEKYMFFLGTKNKKGRSRGIGGCDGRPNHVVCKRKRAKRGGRFQTIVSARPLELIFGDDFLDFEEAEEKAEAEEGGGGGGGRRGRDAGTYLLIYFHGSFE
jgi:predicted secreted acid phosphatase